MWRLALVWSSITHKTRRVLNATEYFVECLSYIITCLSSLSLGVLLVMAAHSKFLNHTMPKSDEVVQRLVEERTGIRPCLLQIKVVQMILAQWDGIEIAATGLGKSLPYWMALLFIKYGIVVLVTPLKLLGEQFVRVLEKNKLTAVSMTASNSIMSYLRYVPALRTS
jgi:hypothetical protein